MNNGKLKCGSFPIKKGFITLMGFFPLEIRDGKAGSIWSFDNE